MDMKAIYPDLNSAGEKYNVNFPDTWIRLKRLGDTFESYISSDNMTWNLYSSFTISMPARLYVGLALTSHSKNEYTSSTFMSFQLNR
jgi:regulation of enolase protein 1 (concanavalin A-like superfamily)